MADYEGTSGDDTYAGGAEADYIYGRGGKDNLSGGDEWDYIEGGGDDDIINGDAGDDVLYGDIGGTAGNDLIDGGDGHDLIYGGGGDDDLIGGAGDDILRGEAGTDTLSGGSDNDFLRGGEGIDSFDGGTDTPTVSLITGGFGDLVSFFELRATQGAIADLRTGQISNDGFGNVETMTGIESIGSGTAFADQFYGNDGINYLSGGRADTVRAFGGDDLLNVTGAPSVLDGGAGSDLMTLRWSGGLVPDTNGDGAAEIAPEMSDGYWVDLAAGILVDGHGYAGTISGVERIAATGLHDVLLGSGSNEWFAPGKGSDTIDGRGGVDSLSYAGGHYDYYFDRTGGIFVDLATGQVVETRAEPRISHGLPLDGAAPPTGTAGPGSTAESTDTIAGIENVAGTGLGDTLYGDGGDNRIAPGAGNDVVDGRGGIDTIDYSSARAGVSVRLDSGTAFEGGTLEKVIALPDSTDPNGSPFGVWVAADDYSMTTDQLAGIENAVGSAFADNLVGNAGVNRLEGGAGDDTLDGGAGADAMLGGLGDDIFLVGAGDSVTELAGQGFDWVFTALAAYTLGANVENLQGTSASGQTLTGNGLANVIIGGAGHDMLHGGGGGADQLAGGGGNDIYVVGGGDTVAEDAAAGTDEVRTALASYTLGANVERLTGTSAAGQTLSGNELANTLAGGAGADQMLGGLGNDVYLVGAGDVVTELAGEGTDEVRTSLANYTLGANVERLVGLSASGQTLTGNTLSNFISGGSGADQLAGGLGNDLYLAGAGDTIVELAGEGSSDEVRTALAAYTLGANVEKLTGISATGQGLNGNALANILTGGAGNDVLNGDSGADQLAGGLGNDRYYVGAGDVVIELAGQGTDEVRTALAAYTLAAEVERLTGISATGQKLTGNALSNVIAGGAGNDVLNGGAGGADQMLGGLGDDVYYLGAGDSVTELTGQGSDEVRTGLASYTLAANVERLIGTAAAQALTGNGLANVIEGGLGADVLNGAGGDDIFVYRSAAEWTGDRVDGGTGTDTLQLDGAMGGSGVAFGVASLVAVERILLGSAPAGSFNAYNLSFGGGNIAAGTTLLIDGSALRAGERLGVDAYLEKLGALTVYGGANRDVLNGGSQADVLRGGGGGDYLNGNGGADRFVYTNAADSTGRGFDQIAGFDYRVDRIDLPGSVSCWAPAVNQGRLAGATFDSDLAAALDAALGANQAVLFRPDSGDHAGRLFAVIDANGDGAYRAGEDYVFEFIAPAVPIAPVTGFFV